MYAHASFPYTHPHVPAPLRWNEAHGIRLFRLSSCIFPWMTFYHMEDLPDWTHIQAVSTQGSAQSGKLMTPASVG